MKRVKLMLLLGALMPVAAPGQTADTARVDTGRARLMASVTVTGRAPVVERKRDRTVINVEASPINTGSTVLEVLERSPGVTVDRNGGITLNGKPGVLVMIDDKPTYLSGDDLNNLLSSMNAAQVAKIELIPNPPARYDAAGTAGIINIRTKKSGSEGWNGSITASYGQGIYPKTNNSLMLNYRKGPINTFLNYSINDVHYLTNLYAYRKYLDDNKDVMAVLQQPASFTGTFVNNTAKTGLDYSPSAHTSLGFVLTGTDIGRNGVNNGYANWLNPAAGTVDSSLLTKSTTGNHFQNGSVNAHVRQGIGQYAEIHGDVDYLHFQIAAKENFDNELLTAGGYDSVFRSQIPTTINIWSGQLDGNFGLGGGVKLEAGLKLSSSHTTNAAIYQDWTNQEWVDDNTRGNHFVYREEIEAGYASVSGKADRISYQAGLRYEHTGYTAEETGNSLQPDSTVSRRYGSLFPSGSLSYKIDTLHSLSLTVGRRIDRPVYQTLNPFLYIINKYTYETGNPYLLPQYSWTIELTHQYGDLLTTGVLYSRISNYFSQIFLSDSTGTVLFYTQGNVGSVYNLGVSMTLAVTPVGWWSATLGAVFNHKELRGFNGNRYTSTISQLNVNMSNQFSLGKGYVAELTGFYTTRARNDIQELLYPAGQLSAGLSKPVFRKKGTVRLSFRDMLYTGAMEGFTSFPDATEYFKIKRDSRVVFLSFTLRFGRTYKVVQHEEGASEEKDRVQSG